MFDLALPLSGREMIPSIASPQQNLTLSALHRHIFSSTRTLPNHSSPSFVYSGPSPIKGLNAISTELLHNSTRVSAKRLLSKIQFYGVANFHQGSFGSHAIWDASFLFKVPAGIAPEDATPLMCRGATVFNVIESFNIRPTDRVGVVGIGGLGHFAIQFLAKMGASVVVFSGTGSKHEEAMRLGATEFYTTKGIESFNIGKADHLLVTTSFHPDWNVFLSVLKPTGTIYPLSADTGELRLPFFPIFTQGLTIQASMIAARSVHRRMLDFAARHQVKPIIERFPMTKDGVEVGVAKLREGKMRYRGVLVANAQ